MSNLLVFKTEQYQKGRPLSESYFKKFLRTFILDSRYLFFRDRSDLEDIDAMVFALTDNQGNLVAAHIGYFDNSGSHNFAGAFVPHPQRGRGLLTDLLQRSLNSVFAEGIERVIAHVRVFEDGETNVASLKSFCAAGFHQREEVSVPYSDSLSDHHLVATASESGTFRGIRLEVEPALRGQSA